MGKYLSEGKAKQIAGEIRVAGLDYWVQDYANKSLDGIPELLYLAEEADKALERLQNALADEGAII